MGKIIEIAGAISIYISSAESTGRRRRNLNRVAGKARFGNIQIIHIFKHRKMGEALEMLGQHCLGTAIAEIGSGHRVMLDNPFKNVSAIYRDIFNERGRLKFLKIYS